MALVKHEFGISGALDELLEAFPEYKKQPRKRSAAKSSKKMGIGSRVTYYCFGCHLGEIVAKHENKGWWTVQLDNGVTTSGDRKLFKIV